MRDLLSHFKMASQTPPHSEAWKETNTLNFPDYNGFGDYKKTALFAAHDDANLKFSSQLSL